MMNPIIIEVEMLDMNLHDLLKGIDNPCNIPMISLLQAHLEEQVGGILCMGHYSLPVCSLKRSKGRKVVQISCCCACQMKSIEQRLNEVFKVK
jgi:hypothetical protein